eukprot:TRINITY_DN513_c0_g2_i1.p1 TRINITY_DN513_c0_g2~~TRINITY_DN513_c0_g2_i1.p1  ORF type:complete len:255 (+),score=33.65 TRINITY_DN513_c0_g2_i1:38-802(+)
MGNIFAREEPIKASPNGCQEDWEEKVGRAVQNGKVKAGDVCRLWTECWWCSEDSIISELHQTVTVVEHNNDVSAMGDWLSSIFKNSGDPNHQVFKETWDTAVSRFPSESLQHDLSPLLRTFLQNYDCSPISNSILCALDQGVIFPVFNRILHLIWQPWMTTVWETLSWKVFILPTSTSFRVIHLRTDTFQSASPSVTINYNVVMTISRSDGSLMSSEFNVVTATIKGSWWTPSRTTDMKKVLEGAFPSASVEAK